MSPTRKTLLFAMGLLLAPMVCLSQGDPIDEWLRTAVEESEKTGGTAIMPRHVAPYVEAQRLWDIELNKVYKELMTALPKSGQEKLRAEQRSWLTFRDHRFREIWTEQYEYYGEGNAAVQVTEYLKSNLIKKRVLELRAMLLSAQRPNQPLEPTR